MEAPTWTLNPVSPEPLTEAQVHFPVAFERLFHAEYPRLVAIANRVLADRHEAEDVAQEVFLSFYRKHPADAGYAAAWLHSATWHSSLNVLRGNRRREKRELAVAKDAAPVLADPEMELITSERRDEVRTAMRRLPPKAAAVLALRYSGLSYAEVAQAMGVGIGQVGTLLRRAETRLRKEVTNESPV